MGSSEVQSRPANQSWMVGQPARPHLPPVLSSKSWDGATGLTVHSSFNRNRAVIREEQNLHVSASSIDFGKATDRAFNLRLIDGQNF